tara:strand:- start:451 stop:993 length:543 start_codon:yes stop_codon:yes gene_type:complete
MKFFGLKSFYIVTDIKEHQQKKSQLLKCIDAMPQDSINDGIEVTSKTDWNIPPTHKREYLDIFYEMMKPYMREMASKLRCETWEITNTWYQVYNKPGDKHGWHTHMNANYTNVYYLSLPNRSIKTQLYDIMGNRVIKDVKVREGQVLTFPASIIHRSPVNDNNQKVVISFNSNFCAPNVK